jgi:hypothetical protein
VLLRILESVLRILCFSRSKSECGATGRRLTCVKVSLLSFR